MKDRVPRPIFSNTLADHFSPAEDPTECPRCKRRIAKSKALRRYNRAVDNVQHRFGYCTCGQMLYFKPSP